MFFKNKCPNCGAKNPEGLKACAICGAPFVLGLRSDKLEGHWEPTRAELKGGGGKKVVGEAKITCPRCKTVFFVSHEEDAVICPNPDCRESVARDLNALAEVYRNIGKEDEAERLKTRARKIRSGR